MALEPCHWHVVCSTVVPLVRFWCRHYRVPYSSQHWLICHGLTVNFLGWLSGLAIYSLTSLSHSPLSCQPRFSPPVATGMIFFHVIYLVNSPPSRLALANWWIDNDLHKLYPISRHSRLVVAFLSVSLCQLQCLCHWDGQSMFISLSVGR